MQPQDSDPLANSDQPTVQQGRDTPPAAPVNSGGGLFDSWNKWIDKPNNRAALMQFGIAMLQPVGMGETAASHFGNAIGAAGQAHQNVTKQAEEAERESTSSELRQSRASAAETTANAAEMRALYQGQNTEQRLQIAQQGNLVRALQAQANARSKYDNYALITPEKERLSYNDWIKTPEGRQSLLEGGVDPGAATTPTPTAPAAVTPAVNPTTGGHLTADQVLQHPQIRPRLQGLSRAQIQGWLGPSMTPQELQKLLIQIGAQ